MINVSEEQLRLYLSFFRGRTDVYARRWEKNGKSGYSPAYQFNWNEFLAHRNQGGTMTTFENKVALPLTAGVIKIHLLGQQVVGIYPLLENNTSYFIAADFDGSQAFTEATQLISICAKMELPAYMERSRSGNGAHVWLFFESPYPATRSRTILLECIRQALHLSEFDKEISFDRLFPNQDMLSGKGFGNLIALPLQGSSIQQGNSVFIDPQTLQPYTDQWVFLANFKRITQNTLDKAFAQITSAPTSTLYVAPQSNDRQLLVTLNSGIRLRKSSLDRTTVNFLREELNFPNVDYWLKKRFGKSVYQTEKFFNLIEEDGEDIILPRGFLIKFTDYLRSRNITFNIRDERVVLPEVIFSSSIQLQPQQAKIVDMAMEVEQVVIVAPPGSGKTIIGLELIARRKQPALIICHRQQIMGQWLDRIQEFLGIPKTQIGRIDGVKKSVGEKITVAMMQSMVRMKDVAKQSDKFGLVIVDECHHIPAKTFREVVSGLNARYWYGLTATPKRKHNDEKLIYLFIGNAIAELPENIPEMPAHQTKDIKIEHRAIIRTTDLEVPFSFTADKYHLLARIIACDQSRNQLIVEDIKKLVASGSKTLVLNERKEHLEILTMYLKGVCEFIMITGDDSVASRKYKFAQIQSGHYQIILATGQLIGEGLDVPNIQTIVLAFPLAFDGKLEQYIGRIRRAQKIVYDYRDSKTPFLDRQFKKRKRFYERNGFQIIEKSA